MTNYQESKPLSYRTAVDYHQNPHYKNPVARNIQVSKLTTNAYTVL